MPLIHQGSSKSRLASKTKDHQQLNGQDTQKAPKQQHRDLQQQQQQQPNIRDYKCLGLQLHQGSPVISYVFIKRQRAIECDNSVSNALYVTGLPLGVDETALEAIFQLFGVVHNVVMHPSKRSAAVVYETPDGVSAALKQGSSGQLVQYELPLPEGPVGLKAWVAQHKAARPGNAELQQQLDAWVEAHEAAEAAQRAAQQAAMAEDGWTLVTRTKGRKRSREEGGVSTLGGGVPQTAATAAAAVAAEVQQSRLTENFYRFQQREQRRTELLELRQQFEEGRKRLAALKAARHFKPS